MLARILVIDDLCGRVVAGGRNADREGVCASFLWRDATHDAAAQASRQKVLQPTAEVVFCRGQTPADSGVGAVVENDLAGALAKVRQGWTDSLVKGQLPWAMVLLDLCFYTGRVTEESYRRAPAMPEGRPADDDYEAYFGLTLLDTIHREFPELPVYMLSSMPRGEVSLDFSHRGALGFIDRGDPQAPEQLQAALWEHGLLPDSTGQIVGHSLPLLLALRAARRAARHRTNVLILGESGVGKELVARAIHQHSQRRAARFLAVNCAALAETLLESELFGHERGAFSGADRRKIGKFEQCDNGTIFLDEIGEMSPNTQSKVLRLLQEQCFERVGGEESITTDARIISATNRDLEKMISENTFRFDLYYRLNSCCISLPPLRERRTDIPLLVERILQQVVSEQAGTRPRQVTEEALRVLLDYDWPGNVRELQGVIERALRHADVEHLVPSHLQLPTRRQATEAISTVSRSTRATPSAASPELENLEALQRKIAAMEFDPAQVATWSGKLDQVQRESARLVAKMLEAALQATRKRTPTSPTGELLIHPAAKLLTGDEKLTATKAADLIKRLLAPIAEELEGDLAEAHRIALKIRPRSATRPARPNPSN